MKIPETANETKNIPQRRCAGCREMKDKKQLIRIAMVKSSTNEFYIDVTGKKPGRGAYVCKNAVCAEKALRNKGLERSFKSAVPIKIYEELIKLLTANC